MRILIIHTFYKQTGGEDSVVNNEMALLKAKGIDVSLLTFNNEKNTLLKLLQLPFNFSSFIKTKAHIRSFRPDVVHIHNLHFGGSASVIYAVRACGIPLVMTLHNYRIICPSASLYHNKKLFLDSLKSAFPWSAVKKGVYKNSISLSLWISISIYIHDRLKTWGMVDRFILLGKHSTEIFGKSRLTEYIDRMVVKPNFCCPCPEPRDNTPSYYLYVGRLTEEKGLPVLLKAFAQNDLPLKIVGSGPLNDTVRDYCSKHANITCFPHQSKAQINRLLAGTIALIFPSTWYETFGMVIIEAFSMGVPVITSDLGNMTSMVKNNFNGITFEPGNSEDMNRKLTAYHNLPPADKEQFRKNARDTYQRQYTAEDNFAQLLNVYHSAINKHSYPPLS